MGRPESEPGRSSRRHLPRRGWPDRACHRSRVPFVTLSTLGVSLGLDVPIRAYRWRANSRRRAARALTRLRACYRRDSHGGPRCRSRSRATASLGCCYWRSGLARCPSTPSHASVMSRRARGELRSSGVMTMRDVVDPARCRYSPQPRVHPARRSRPARGFPEPGQRVLRALTNGARPAASGIILL